MRATISGPNLPGALEDLRAFCTLYNLAFRVSVRLPGRPKAQTPVQNVLDALAHGEKVTSISQRLGVPRATVYRVKAGMGVKS